MNITKKNNSKSKVFDFGFIILFLLISCFFYYDYICNFIKKLFMRIIRKFGFKKIDGEISHKIENNIT